MYIISKLNKSVNRVGSFLSLPAHGRAGARATLFLAAHFAKRNTKFGSGTPVVERFAFTTGQEARAGKNYQKSASGFSRKKVRILFRTDSQFVKFAFSPSLGAEFTPHTACCCAGPLASADKFSSNFQTNQSFFRPKGERKAAIFLPKSGYKFNQINL